MRVWGAILEPDRHLGLYRSAISASNVKETSRLCQFSRDTRKNLSNPHDLQPAQHQLLSATMPPLQVWGAILKLSRALRR